MSAEADALREAMEETLQSLWAASMVLDHGGVGEQSSEPFLARMAEVAKGLERVSEKAKGFDIPVPLSIVERVDTGLNPDEVTKEAVLYAKARNDEARGKLLATQALKEQLEARLKVWEEHVKL